MRALIAGVAGSLGSLLCDRLRHDGIEVRGLDNFYTGRRENIRHPEGDPGLSFFEHDITWPISAAVAGPLDVIFNMARPASPLAYRLEFLHYYDEDITLHTKPIDYSKGFVKRTPNNDEIASHPFRPMSIVVDCIK